jgi:hypothetical protein
MVKRADPNTGYVAGIHDTRTDYAQLIISTEVVDIKISDEVVELNFERKIADEIVSALVLMFNLDWKTNEKTNNLL